MMQEPCSGTDEPAPTRRPSGRRRSPARPNSPAPAAPTWTQRRRAEPGGTPSRYRPSDQNSSFPCRPDGHREVLRSRVHGRLGICFAHRHGLMSLRQPSIRSITTGSTVPIVRPISGLAIARRTSVPPGSDKKVSVRRIRRSSVPSSAIYASPHSCRSRSARRRRQWLIEDGSPACGTTAVTPVSVAQHSMTCPR